MQTQGYFVLVDLNGILLIRALKGIEIDGRLILIPERTKESSIGRSPAFISHSKEIQLGIEFFNTWVLLNFKMSGLALDVLL